MKIRMIIKLVYESYLRKLKKIIHNNECEIYKINKIKTKFLLLKWLLNV